MEKTTDTVYKVGNRDAIACIHLTVNYASWSGDELNSGILPVDVHADDATSRVAGTMWGS